MSSTTFMDKIRSFFGLRTEPPRNDFRNPIWGSDDDDDGDELYTRQQMETYDPLEMHREFVKNVQDIFKNFGSIFGDMKAFMGHGDMESFGTITDFPETEQGPENFDSNRIRDYYLKPGYHDHTYEHPREDINLDGKISSDEFSGLLQQKDGHLVPQTPFNGTGRSFCKTIITTSITKPDGTIETRRIIKNGNEIIEERTTTESDTTNPYNPGLNPIQTTHMMLSQLSSLLRNFY